MFLELISSILGFSYLQAAAVLNHSEYWWYYKMNS